MISGSSVEMYASPYGPRMPPANGWGARPPPWDPWAQRTSAPWEQWSGPPPAPRARPPPVDVYQRPPPPRRNVSFDDPRPKRYPNNRTSNGINGPPRGPPKGPNHRNRSTTKTVDDVLNNSSTTWQSIEPRREKSPERKWRVTKLKVEPVEDDEWAPFDPADPYAEDPYAEDPYGNPSQGPYSQPAPISPSPAPPPVFLSPYYRPRYPPAPPPVRYPWCYY